MLSCNAIAASAFNWSWSKRLEIASLRARLAFFDLSEEIDAMSSSEKTGGNASGGWESSHSTTGGHCITISRGDKAYIIRRLERLLLLLSLEPPAEEPCT